MTPKLFKLETMNPTTRLTASYHRRDKPETRAATVAKKVYVTRVQRDAAKMLVTRSSVTGRYVSSNVRKIANAQTMSQKSGSHARTPTEEK